MILPLITSAQTFMPNKGIFWGSEKACLLARHAALRSSFNRLRVG